MATATKDKSTKKKKTVGPAHVPDYVMLSVYITRKHNADLEKDTLAKPLTYGSITREVKRGNINLYQQGTYTFIDWNLYKDHIFKRHQ